MPVIPLLVAMAASSAISSQSFADVPADAWYATPVQELAIDGHIDPNKTHFHPEAPATRAQFLKLALSIAGREPGPPPMLASFDDVAKDAWYYALMEEAGKEGWVRGDGDCYGSHPCKAYPNAPINRAQAAALLVRIQVLERTKSIRHNFIDVGDTDWFAYAVFAMADRCILQGDPLTQRIRPQDGMNRAEMAVMFRRAQLALSGRDVCPRSTL